MSSDGDSVAKTVKKTGLEGSGIPPHFRPVIISRLWNISGNAALEIQHLSALHVINSILLITCFASGFPQVAQAQFQAGSFVDGQPVFASNRSRGAIMRLRGRRSGVRQARKRWRKRARQDRQARRRAVDKLPTVGQSRARGRLVGVATNDQRDFQLPPLPPQ